MSRSAFQNDDRQKVLEATDVVALIGEHLSLKQRGREFLCVCPFHDDHKPSMYVVPAKQIYHCFSCGAGGNAIDFVINYHKMDFLDALRFLADRAGVPLTPRRAAGGALGAEAGGESDGEPELSRASLIEVSRFANEFFRAILRHPEHGARARELLARRGLDEATAEAFEIGAAPDRWDGLLVTAQKRGVSIEGLERLGLIKRRAESSGHYDAFRGRLIFPIHDQAGRPIAFGGRRLNDEDDPKYLNSPESALFHKSRTLFALKQASRAIQRENLAIVTEGYMDAIACHQAGLTHTVATLGTALTPEHARMLQRLCDRVALLFDSDEAGLRAADRAVEAFFAAPIDVKIVRLDDAKDPDELLKQPGGLEALRAAIDAADDALAFRTRRLRERLAGAGMSARARIIEEDLARLAELGLHTLSPVRKRLVVRRYAEVAGVPEADVLRALSQQRQQTGRRDEEGPAPERGPIDPRAGALGALLSVPGMWLDLDRAQQDALREAAYALGPVGAAVDAIAAHAQDGASPDVSLICTALDDSDARRAAVQLAFEAERCAEADHERVRDFFRDCLRRILHERALSCNEDAGEPIQDRLERIRQVRRAFGDRPTSLPRPA
ncbi:MAG: DNA primase [Phycisphaerales bacterium]|nr:DNA primase [Phycisphaerales bacterium]